MKQNWIRIVYLYLMTTIGLVVLIIGFVSLINLGLKALIFTKAESDYYESIKPSPLYLEREVEQVNTIKSCEDLSDTDKQVIENWLSDYQKWKDQEQTIDYKRARRERDAAQALAMILVGFPVYLYHWGVIKRDKGKKKEE